MQKDVGSVVVKRGLAQMLKGGVIMDVVTPEHARIAEDAGACAVMALERVPADIRADGGVARMSDPELILQIMDAVSIPVMAKCRIGHFVEAQILEAIGVDYIDESEVLTPADEAHHINKHTFKVPFVCGCRNLGEALRRVGEGAAMIRTKGEAGTGDVVEAVRHARSVLGEIRRLQNLVEEELMSFSKEIGAPYELVLETRSLGRMPVVNFAAGGVAIGTALAGFADAVGAGPGAVSGFFAAAAAGWLGAPFVSGFFAAGAAAGASALFTGLTGVGAAFAAGFFPVSFFVAIAFPLRIRYACQIVLVDNLPGGTRRSCANPRPTPAERSAPKRARRRVSDRRSSAVVRFGVDYQAISACCQTAPAWDDCCITRSGAKMASPRGVEPLSLP